MLRRVLHLRPAIVPAIANCPEVSVEFSNSEFSLMEKVVSSCLLISEIPVKKGLIFITMRAIKSFDTLLFVSSCLQILEIPVTVKG